MKTKKTSQKGKYALVIGIVAGFAVLTLIFRAFSETSTAKDVVTGVAIIASLISVFVASLAASESRPCKTDATVVK